MNIQIEELLEYLKGIELEVISDERINGYNDCIEDIKKFSKMKFNQICNV